MDLRCVPVRSSRMFFFFFSSRRRHTRCLSDWSSDVCSSDLFSKDEAGDKRSFHFATGATALIYRLGKPLRLLRRRFPQNEILVTVVPTEEIVAGLLARQFDLGLISMPVPEDKLPVLPLREEELMGLRPAHGHTGGAKAVQLQPAELRDAPFLLYPPRSNMRLSIDTFFRQLGIAPRVIMECDDTEAIKRLVESGFGYSMLPEFSLRGQSRFLQVFRVAGRRLGRRQGPGPARAGESRGRA